MAQTRRSAPCRPWRLTSAVMPTRQVYHTPRMQRVFAVRFSGDGSYVFSGSDDMNVRVWKVCALEGRKYTT